MIDLIIFYILKYGDLALPIWFTLIWFLIYILKNRILFLEECLKDTVKTTRDLTKAIKLNFEEQKKIKADLQKKVADLEKKILDYHGD